MKKLLSILLTLVLIFASVGNCFATSNEIKTNDDTIQELLTQGEYQEGSVVVLLDNSVPVSETKSRILNLLNPNRKGDALLDDAELIMDLDNDDEQDKSIVLIQSSKYSTKQLLNKLISNPRVLTVEPNYIYTLDDSSINSQTLIYDNEDNGQPEDTTEESKEPEIYIQTEIPDYTDYQWAMNHEGEDEDLYSMFYDDVTLGDDIGLEDWNSFDKDGNPIENASGVIVVCDTGIDYTHPDLKNVMFEIPESIYSEIGGCKYGINTIASGYTPDEVMDDHSHGTHCAGIIAAEWNDFGTSGVASGVKLVAVKCLGKDGSATFVEIAQSLEYVARLAEKLIDTDTPVRAVNFSLGGDYLGTLINEAAKKVGKYGVVVCVAAGNETSNINLRPYSSTGLDLCDNVVVVSASNINGAVAYYSNYGDASDIFAPGTAIVSTVTTLAKTYNPYLDPSPIFKDNFDGEFGEFGADEYLGAYVETTFDSWVNIGSINNTKGDIDSSCVEITYDEIRENWDDLRKIGGYYPSIAVGVPLEGIDLDEVKYIAMSVQAEGGVGVYSGVYVVNPESEEPTTVRVEGNGISIIDYESLTSGGCEPYIDEYNNLWLFVAFENTIYTANAQGSVFIDGITLGYNKLNYMQMNGTSMATPAVTGATAVIYEQNKKAIEKLAVEDRAAYLANLVKASVSDSRHENAYDGYCKTGGQLDLTQSATSPVINSITYKKGYIVISGEFFGKTKTNVHVNGKEATIKSWTNNTIKLTPDKGTSSGAFHIEVETKNGKSYYQTVTLDFGDNVLFENQINLPDNVRQSTIDIASAVNGDLIYTLSTACDESAVYLSSYNMTTNTWTYISSPKVSPSDDKIHYIENPQMVYTNGKLVIQCKLLDAAEDESQGFIVYDLETDTWYYPDLVMPSACYLPGTQPEGTADEEIITTSKGISGANLITLGGEAYYVGGVYTVKKQGYLNDFVGALGLNYNTENINKLVLDLDNNQIIMEGAGFLMKNVLDENGNVIGTTTYGGIFAKNNSCSYGNTAYIAVAKTWDWPTKDYTPFGYKQVMHNERIENVLFKIDLNEETGEIVVTDRSSIMPGIDFTKDQTLSLALDDAALVMTAIGGDTSKTGLVNMGDTYVTDEEARGTFKNIGKKASLGYSFGPTSVLKEGTLYTIGRSFFESFENGDTTFMRSTKVYSEKDVLSRATLVTMLWKLAGSPYVNYAMSFTDVAEDQSYTDAIRWAQSEGIVKGYNAESFGPNDAVTREELATIFYRYEQNVNDGGFKGMWMFLLNFDDVDQISDWAHEAMHWMVQKGIIIGTGNNKLSPKGTATREQAEIMIQRYSNLNQ